MIALKSYCAPKSQSHVSQSSFHTFCNTIKLQRSLALSLWLQGPTETIRRECSHFPSSKSVAILYRKAAGSLKSQFLSLCPVSPSPPRFLGTSSHSLLLFSLIPFPFYWINFQSSQLCSNIFHSRQHNPKQKKVLFHPFLAFTCLSTLFIQSSFIEIGSFMLSSSLLLNTKSRFYSHRAVKTALKSVTSNFCILYTECCSKTSKIQWKRLSLYFIWLLNSILQN